LFLKFEAKGKTDAHIFLSDGKGSKGIEIVIGGWNGTKSVIREKKQGEGSVEETPEIVSETEYKKFWILVVMADGEVKVSVGRGHDHTHGEFMSKQVPISAYSDIKYVAFACWDSNKIDWKVPKVSDFSTTGYNYISYKILGIDKVGHPTLQFSGHEDILFLQFQAKGERDAHILLTDGRGNDGIEIVIGGWNNSQSVIRANKQRDDTDIAKTENILSNTELRPFWISVVKRERGDMDISVGQGDDTDHGQFMSASFPTCHITHVAFACWNDERGNSTINWQFTKPQEKSFSTSGYRYKFCKILDKDINGCPKLEF